MSELLVDRSVSHSLPTRCFTVVTTPCDCTPRMYAAASLPLRSGSSEKHSKLRPASGARWRFTVGARSTRACLVRVSRPSNAPSSSTSAGFQVAPRADPLGMHVAIESPDPCSEEPRAPLGPSVVPQSGMPSRSTPVSVKKPEPAVSAPFSSMVSASTSSPAVTPS